MLRGLNGFIIFALIVEVEAARLPQIQNNLVADIPETLLEIELFGFAKALSPHEPGGIAHSPRATQLHLIDRAIR